MANAEQDRGTHTAGAERPTADAERPTADELLALLRQERADFQNYRRRVGDERAADLERVRGKALEPLFPLLDDLGRAFVDIPPELADDPWARGIAALHGRLAETLAALGLETVGSPGESFDPTRHEALLFEPDPAARRQEVMRVIRPGYRLGGRLLRPAEVVVRGPVPDGSNGMKPDQTSSPDDARQSVPAARGRPTDDPAAGG
jgi:molecular chaperone GrpE